MEEAAQKIEEENEEQIGEEEYWAAKSDNGAVEEDSEIDEMFSIFDIGDET